MERLVENPARTPPVSVRMVALRSVLLLALSGWLAWPLMAQQSSSAASGSGQASSSPTSSSQSQQTPPPHKSTAQENPFPEDLSRQAAQPQSQPAADAPAAPDVGQQAPPKPSDAAEDNPFPEDVSKRAADAAAKSSDASDGSSSSSSSSSSADDADPNADDLPRNTGRRKLRKPSDSDIQSGSLAGEGRAQEDVKVGRYYLGTKDYKGAYARFSDASRLDPASLDAIYGLAAAAAGLHRTDEALANYKLYLEIAPDGDDAKSARKALRELSK